MKQDWQKDFEDYAKSHLPEVKALLKEWAAISAPSHQEEQRARAVKTWLSAQGAEGVQIDEAGNVVYEMGCEKAERIAVFMAHMDVVFPDTEAFTVKEEDGRMYAPGIGDDTANLVLLMMSVKYLLERKAEPAKGWGILFAANVCEEGLGNLKGSRAVCEKWKDKIAAFYSLDGYLGWAVTQAVGSQRYRVTVRTEGGHSYSAFGNPNAIHILSGLIQSLYAVRLPDGAKTTYNVGTIQGGTTINSIAQEASMTYEFRSEDHKCLKYMEDFFYGTVKALGLAGWDVETEVLGIRPCNKGVDQEALRSLEESCRKVISMYWDGQVKTKASSTDANIPLSMGIPACTVGCVAGGGAHTREEWIETDSLLPGFLTALGMVMRYISS